MKTKVFIAHSMGMSEDARRYAKELEDVGYEVYLPCRDTVQLPPNTTEDDLPSLDWEYHILAQNLEGVKWCDEVHCIWDLSSLGTIFDLGCAYALNKQIYMAKTKRYHWVKFLLKKEEDWIIV